MNTVLKANDLGVGKIGVKNASESAAEKKRRKKSMNSRSLKQHLKYLVPEIRLALIKEPAKAPPAILGPEDIDLFIEPLKHYPEENFVSFHMNAKMEVIGHQIVSRGTVNASLVHPREVFKAAIINNSYALIVAHNHPGGSLTPSAEDIETTRQLIKAGKLIGISVVDHIIVASTGCHSIREGRPDLWTD